MSCLVGLHSEWSLLLSLSEFLNRLLFSWPWSQSLFQESFYNCVCACSYDDDLRISRLLIFTLSLYYPFRFFFLMLAMSAQHFLLSLNIFLPLGDDVIVSLVFYRTLDGKFCAFQRFLRTMCYYPYCATCVQCEGSSLTAETLKVSIFEYVIFSSVSIILSPDLSYLNSTLFAHDCDFWTVWGSVDTSSCWDTHWCL